MKYVYVKTWYEHAYITQKCEELQELNPNKETTQIVEFLADPDFAQTTVNEFLEIPKDDLEFIREEEELRGVGPWWDDATLTQRRLDWFVTLKEAIEKRGTVCADYLYRAKIPSVFNEELSSIDGETVVMRRHMRGEWYYTEFPLACLWDDTALHTTREKRDQIEAQKYHQHTEEERQQELRNLKRLAEKYPEFFDGETFRGSQETI